MLTQSTRDMIVAKADILFYERGFDTTSLADIAAPLGISRGNFYHHFKSKDAILDAVIDLRLRATSAMLERWEDAAATPRRRILSFIHLLIVNRSKIMAHGCPVGTLCSELAKLDHAFQHRAAQIMGLFRSWLTAQFRAHGTGDQAERLAMHLLTWSQGVAVLATAFGGEEIIRTQVAEAELWLDQQLGPDLNA
jgi:TetR/AcrR family transcriptional repressor of nem operon